MKRIVGIVLCVCLLLGLQIPGIAVLPVAGAASGEAVVSVEAFPIKAGYLVEPVLTPVRGETAAQTLINVLSENGLQAFGSGSADGGFYLAYVAGGDKQGSYNGYRALCSPVSPRTLQIKPKFHPSLRTYLETYMEWFDPSDETVAAGYLGEFCISAGSGWMFSLNGEFLQKELSAFKLKAGDVLRVQFTTCFGADVGGAVEGTADAFTLKIEDRTELTAAIAKAKKAGVDRETVEYAVNVASNPVSAPGDIRFALAGLSAGINRIEAGIDRPQPSAAPTEAPTLPPATAAPTVPATAAPATTAAPTTAPGTTAPGTTAPPTTAPETGVTQAASDPELTVREATAADAPVSESGTQTTAENEALRVGSSLWKVLLIFGILTAGGAILAFAVLKISKRQKENDEQ
ncbi:MAG: hypothetical protein IJK02_04915 [Clostridia bacterium]|nr:hypothetical protein [Clostridia bacterium]